MMLLQNISKVTYMVVKRVVHIDSGHVIHLAPWIREQIEDE